VGCGYHLHPHAGGIHVPCRHLGLVQPVCGVLEAVQQPGSSFCLEMLEEALSMGNPLIFNTD